MPNMVQYDGVQKLINPPTRLQWVILFAELLAVYLAYDVRHRVEMSLFLNVRV